MPTATATTETTDLIAPRHYPIRFSGGVVTASEGTYNDHTDDRIRGAAFAMRSAGETFQVIADALNIQHWHFAQRAVEAHARLTGEAMPRSYRRTSIAPRAIQRHLLDRRFGVELECSRGTMRSGSDDHLAAGHPVTTAASFMRAQGIDAQPSTYNHITPTNWKVTYDSTVSGVEAVSPILRGDAGYEQLVAATRGLKAAGATPGGGIHIHHDVTDFTADDLARLARNFKHTQMALASYIPGSRLRGGWCNIVADSIFDNVERCATEGSFFVNNSANRSYAPGFRCPTTGRYEFFNWTSVGTYGTVEFRAHGATLNPVKLRTWIAAGQAVIEFTRQGHEFGDTQSVESMLDTLSTLGFITATSTRSFKARVTELHGAGRLTQVRSNSNSRYA